MYGVVLTRTSEVAVLLVSIPPLKPPGPFSLLRRARSPVFGVGIAISVAAAGARGRGGVGIIEQQQQPADSTLRPGFLQLGFPRRDLLTRSRRGKALLLMLLLLLCGARTKCQARSRGRQAFRGF